MDHSFEVAIVGAGIVGLSTALALSAHGLRTLVVDRGRCGAEQSSRAWGFVRQQGRNAAELPLAAEANCLWIELTRRYGASSTGFEMGGILVPAENEDDEARVVSGFEVAREFKLSTRILQPSEIQDLIPELAGNWRCGLYTPGDAHADPRTSIETIARAVRAAGVTVRENEPVLAVDIGAGRVIGLVSGERRYKANVVVLASGIGTPVLARGVGVELPIQTIRSSVGQTEPTRKFTRVGMWAPQCAYRPAADGSLIIGNGYRGVGADYDLTFDSLRSLRHFLPAYRRNWRLLRLRIGHEFVRQMRASLSAQGRVAPLPEPRPNHGKVAHNLAALKRLFPHLSDIGLSRSWAGRIDLTPDMIPIIDKPRRDTQLFVAAGFSGHGFALGPSVGRQLVEWIVRGRPQLDLSAFRLSRFAEGAGQRSKQAL